MTNMKSRSRVLGGRKLDQVGDDGEMGPGPACLDHLPDRVGFSGQDRLDTAVLTIAHPSVDAASLCLPRRPGAKAHALNPPADDEMARLAHVGTPDCERPGYDAPGATVMQWASRWQALRASFASSPDRRPR